jgi:damage-control phosphatase, subfamily I
MHTYVGCIPCFISQTLEASRLASPDPAIHEQALRFALRTVAEMDMSTPPPAMAAVIHRVIRDLSGVADPYAEAKRGFNQFARSLEPRLAERIHALPDPLNAAIHLAAAGNIVDLGVKSQLNTQQVGAAIEAAFDAPLDPADLAEFRSAVHQARRILYLGDNSGEIVFDRMLIQQFIADGVDAGKITFAVRGGPIINDALMADAVDAGLTGLVEVIDNGDDAPGTILARCSDAFRERFAQADLIISKGQGNYETLSDVAQPVWFLLKVKCPVIAEDVGCPLGTLILRRKVPAKG